MLSISFGEKLSSSWVFGYVFDDVSFVPVVFDCLIVMGGRRRRQLRLFKVSKGVFLDGRCGAKGIGRGCVHVDFLVFLFSASQPSDGFGSYCALRNLSSPATGLLREPSLS